MSFIFTVRAFDEVFELKSEIKLGDILRVDPIEFIAPRLLFRNITGHNNSAEDWELIVSNSGDAFRYFLITIRCKSKISDYTLQQSTFPSRAQIVKDAAEKYGDDVPITILNIFEFKTDEDYYSFISK